ncbi:hypothetical protein MHYP_G00005170 [Metynnis hypsauchen]
MIFPDYTAAVAKARAAFTEVRKVLRNRQGVRYGILFPARFRVSYKGEDKEFTDADKAMAFVKKHVIPTAETEGSESYADPSMIEEFCQSLRFPL